jgi:hypothetical protein
MSRESTKTAGEIEIVRDKKGGIQAVCFLLRGGGSRPGFQPRDFSTEAPPPSARPRNARGHTLVGSADKNISRLEHIGKKKHGKLFRAVTLASLYLQITIATKGKKARRLGTTRAQVVAVDGIGARAFSGCTMPRAV